MSIAPIRIVPLVGLRIPTRVFRRVLLPAPLGPRSPKTSPEVILRETLSRATRVPYCFVRFSMDISTMLVDPFWRTDERDNVAILNDQLDSSRNPSSSKKLGMHHC